MTQAKRVLSTPPTNTPISQMNLTQPSERFDTLAEAENTLKHQGFTLVPDTCNWIDEAGLIDAGVHRVEEAYGVSKYRIEYRTLKGKRGVMALPSHTPVDATSRRRFLSHAAGVAAGGTVLALGTVSPQPSVAAPVIAIDPANISPSLRASAIALGDAHDRLEAAKARFDAGDRRVAVWYDANPEPTGKRARKRWARRWRENHDAVVGQSWAAQLEAEKRFRDALIAVAVIKSRDMNDLAIKACLSGVYDKVHLSSWPSSAAIGYSVALDLVALTMAPAVAS